ncbi:hypothetical protein PGTUg99_035424 [Puccinia graminis f. sp. tritici]|uniref:Uncharacterized protein n=1 Tax=Puccinia graminis f. sp. tritici TaxID=56615 RepID=A0A5B0RGG2_PUCGR|nr:hypothetical protein PGTUg99_035424 [Puccinia graminis f. sp. tritici]
MHQPPIVTSTAGDSETLRTADTQAKSVATATLTITFPLQPHSTITPHLYENMSAVRAPNHPATFNGHFQPITDNEDFEVELVTNTALNNTLMADSIYALSGKLFALNDGSTPTLSYFQDSVIRIGATGPEQPDFTNKSIVTSLGMVISRREVASNVSDSGSHLEVIVAHCDWDGQYIVPGTKNLVKTHTLYQIGREINIIGRLVDFHMEDHMAVVVDIRLAVPTPVTHPHPPHHQFQGENCARYNGPSTSQAPKPTSPAQPILISAKCGSTLKESAKGKNKAPSDIESGSEESSETDESEPSETDVQPNLPPQAKRGRPRKNIIKEAAKRMRKN